MMQILGIRTPRTGLRVIKTAIAAGISMYVASKLHVPGYSYAGVISVLAMQQSFVRSLSLARIQMGSALIGATLGSFAAFFVGGYTELAGVLVYLIFLIHLRLGWKSTITIAVVTGLSAFSTFRGSLLGQITGQIEIVSVGILSSLLVNILGPTPYGNKTRQLIERVSGMQRSLLYLIYTDLAARDKMPYRFYEQQIADILAYIEEAEKYAALVLEDKRIPLRKSNDGTKPIRTLRVMERQMETIRMMARFLYQTNPESSMIPVIQKFILLLIRIQKRVLLNQHVPFSMVDCCLKHLGEDLEMMELPKTHKDFLERASLYPFIESLKTYYEKLKRLQ